MRLVGMLGIVVLCAGIFYWHNRRQATYAETRALLAPFYAYSGKLTPEEQKRFSELTHSCPVDKKYAMPKRERLQWEAHIMALYRNNPELMFMPPFSADTDVEPYLRHFSILALIARTQLADLPAGSRSKMIRHLETLDERLTKNSVEIHIEKVKNFTPGPTQRLPMPAFGIVSASLSGNDRAVLKENGSVEWPEGARRGVIHLTDAYKNEHVVDLDAPPEAGTTEDTTELYAEIDRLFEQLTGMELQRLSALGKAERSAEIEKLFSLE